MNTRFPHVPRLRVNLTVKLTLINVAVIGIAMLAVWLSIDILAADYTTRLMREFNILPIRTHWIFLSTVHRYLMWSALVALSLAVTFSLLLTRRVLRPLKQMRRATAEIAGGNYGQRLTVTTHDEIADLARDLNAMAAGLEKVEQLRQDMVADVAHELRTPLTNMQGYIEGLIDGVVVPSPEEFKRLHEETLRLVTLVDDLLRLAEADAATTTSKRERVRLVSLVDNVIAMVARRTDKPAARVRATLPGDLCVWGDPDKLVQVLHNLVDNAMRYSPPQTPVTIQGEASDAGRTATVTVTNQCDTRQEEDFEFNFERFHRSEKSRSRRYGGAGIGLTIVRKLIEAQGGTVRGTSANGIVTVALKLPRKRDFTV